MIFYIIIFFLIVLFYLLSLGDDKKNMRLPFAIVMLCLSLFVGISDMLGGYDRYIYCELFDNAAETRLNNYPILSSLIFQEWPKEQLYCWFNIFLTYITQNRYIFILITTIIIFGLFYKAIKDYTDNYWFALLLFMGLMFFFTFTYLRQMLGVGVSIFALRFIYERKLFKFLLVVLIATLFHNSALILLPLYFIPLRKLTPSLIICIMILCLVIGLTSIPTTLFDTYGDVAQMEERAAGYVEDSGAFRFEYLLEVVFFLILIFIRYDDIEDDPKSISFLNMSFVFCAILLLFIRSLNGGRLAWYYIIGLIVTLTTLYGKRIDKSNVLIICVSLFLYLRILFAWNIFLYPYKTFFTNGHRDGDFIYNKYEYDQQYDKDKFYK